MITEACASGREFEIGAVYIATPALEGQPKRLGVVVGWQGETVQVAFVDELAVGKMEIFEGREFARVETKVGQYNLSACVKAAAKDAAIVNDILKHQQRKGAGR